MVALYTQEIDVEDKWCSDVRLRECHSMNCSNHSSDNNTSGSGGAPGSPTFDVSSVQWWYCFFGAVGCLVMSGLASGINIGLMSLSPLSLQLLVDASPADKRRDPSLRLQARRASKVLPLVARKHVVLVTLLLTTAIADEVLPLCIDAIAPTWVAVVVSVTTMLIFTEVIPTAMFTDPRSNLKLAAGLAPFVWTLLGVLGVLTWPMARALSAFVERTQKQVGDADSLAGSYQGDEVAEGQTGDGGPNDRMQNEARQLLKVARFGALLRILNKEAHHRSALCASGSARNGGVGQRQEGAAVAAPSERHLDLTQVYLLQSVVRAPQHIHVADVMEPIASRQLQWDGMSDAGGQSTWVDTLARHTARRGLLWFVVQGLHGAGTWDVFVTSDVIAAGDKGCSLVDALLECSAQRYERPLTVHASATLCDAEALRRHLAPQAPIVLVHTGGSEDVSIINGVVHMEDALRRWAMPTAYWEPSPTKRASIVAAQHLPLAHGPGDVDLRADSVLHQGDDTDEDISTLLNGPRVANAVPWSIKYASSSVW